MLLKRIALKNLLSFGPQGIDLELRPLNVFIGPNGSGKSNLIDAISVLQSAPRVLAEPVRDGGGIANWLWKGEQEKGVKRTIASIAAVVEHHTSDAYLKHTFSFEESLQRFELTAEKIECGQRATSGGCDDLYLFAGGQAEIRVQDAWHAVGRAELQAEKSILSLRKDPDQYPEITWLGEQYDAIRIYREWSFGRETPVRSPQKTDQQNDFLNEDCSNLAMVLNQLCRKPAVKARILKMLNRLYSGIDDFNFNILGGTVQVFLQEGKITIPATRLSDGTLRYLCLLAILCHPDPPSLICIEEPELGLHPDVMPAICDLLREASERTQLIVTTHSDMLVDDLTSSPEDVVVCEKNLGQSEMHRLDGDELQKWLKDYSLGELWMSGEIGGKRW